MPIDPSGVIEWLERTLAGIPAALLVIAFLAGPTAAWFLYRYLVRPRANHVDMGTLDLLWICERCRSANEIRSSRCYACGLEVDAMTGELEIVDGTGVTGSPGVGEVGDMGDAGSSTELPALSPTAGSGRPPTAVGPGPRPTTPVPIPVEPEVTEGVPDEPTPRSPR
jgi:hypothetical protein